MQVQTWLYTGNDSRITIDEGRENDKKICNKVKIIFRDNSNFHFISNFFIVFYTFSAIIYN